MTARSRRALAFVMFACAPLAGGGCARDATGVVVTVAADATVPPILILRTTMTRTADPSQSASSNRTSPFGSDDAGDRPGPFVFPVDLSVTIDESYAGPVVVTIEGLDWDTGAVTARGSADAVVIARSTTRAALTLTAAPATGLDGGVD
jgi:hypothetical protein